MPGLYTGSTGLWGGYTGLLFSYTSLSTPPGFLADAYSPAQLFLQGEQGVWYQPSDFSTMFQDAAGTTPVTAVEQPVGLILDKSKSLAIGPELVTNGTFDSTTTGWTGVRSTLAVSSGQLTVTGTGSYPGVYQAFSTTSGILYRVTFSIPSLGTTTTLRVTAKNGTTDAAADIVSTDYTTTGTKTFMFFAAGANSTVFFLSQVPVAFNTFTIDNVSVVSIAGNHASQSTSGARPTLSARVNLLTYTEQFDNAIWSKTGLTVSPDTTVAPDGTTTADTLVWASGTGPQLTRTATTITAGSALTYSAYAKAGTKSSVMLILFTDGSNFVTCTFNLSSGTAGTPAISGTQYTGAAASISVAANGFYRCVLTSSTNTLTSVATWIRGDTMAGSGDTIVVWGADLRPSNQVNAGMPNYQRIADANTYDTSGFPYYLAFDGTDDFLVTGTINPGSVDKAQVFAGVRKIGTADAMIVELSVDASSNSGSFYVGGPLAGGSWRYAFISRGTATASAITTDAAYNSPITNVLTAQSGISTNNATLRLNGAEAGTSSANQGTGNFGSYPLYIGRRAGTSLPFNGRIYGLIVRFSATNLPNGVIVQTEDWMDVQTFGEDLVLVYSDELTTALGELITAADGDQIYMTVSYV